MTKKKSAAPIVREGRELNVLKAGDKRRIYDGRNAYRKMTPEQRVEFRAWLDNFDTGQEE